MAMNDEETVALVAGGHTFGKGHGAAPPGDTVGPAPNDGPIESQGLGWKNSLRTGKGVDAITSGLEGAWTAQPTKWDNGYFDNLFNYEWEMRKGPGGAQQWYPKDGAAADLVPDAHDATKRHQPTMFTTDMALRVDPAYEKISRRFWKDPAAFADAFAKAWYKLCHRDMGPRTRCLGNDADVPPPQIWQDPCPAPVESQHKLEPSDVSALKKQLLDALPIASLIDLAWGSASTFRISDFRGGANGARIRLAPQRNWPSNNIQPGGGGGLDAVLKAVEGIQAGFNKKAAGTKTISLADLIVLGGCAAVEAAAKNAGKDVQVPFTPGRTDTTDANTDAESFSVLEPRSDGFRNYGPPSVHALIDRAQLLTLSAPEMAVLVGGLRVLNVVPAHLQGRGVLTADASAAKLNNDFFVNLVDMTTSWEKAAGGDEGVYNGIGADGQKKWTASSVDLIFGSNPELRAISEYYAQSDSKDEFIEDFAKAFGKVMNLDQAHYFRR